MYNAAISAAASGGVVEVATDLLEEMLEAGASPHLAPLVAPPPDLSPLTRSLTACPDPRLSGASPNLFTYNSCLKACERCADGTTALKLLTRMRRDGIDPDQISYTSAVGALGRQGEWERAIGLWGAMADAGVEPDGMALHTLLRCLTSSGQWRIAEGMYERADAAGFEAASTAAATLAAIGACAAAARQLGSSEEGVEQARKAVSLLQRLAGGDGRGATVGCYRAAVDACCAAGEWRAGLSIWQRASRTQQLRPDTKMYRLLARACRAAGADDELADLLASAEREGVPMMALQEADDDGVGPADTSSDDDDDEVAEELATTALGWENM